MVEPNFTPPTGGHEELIHEATAIAAGMREAAGLTDATALRLRMIGAASIIERLAALPPRIDADAPQSLSERIAALREDRLFATMAVIDVCADAVDFESELSLNMVLKDAYRQLDRIASDMEILSGEVRKLEAAGAQDVAS